MKDGIARSPLFYVGDKYKLVREIRTHFPQQIHRLIEPFVGGGSVMMNVEAEEYLLNDIDSYVIALHHMLTANIGRENEFYDEEKGLAMAIIKYLCGNIGYYNKIFKDFVKVEETEEE